MTYLSLSLRGKVVLLSNIYQFDEVTRQWCTDMTYFRISKIKHCLTQIETAGGNVRPFLISSPWCHEVNIVWLYYRCSVFIFVKIRVNVSLSSQNLKAFFFPS